MIRAMYGLDVATADDKYIAVFEKAAPTAHMIVSRTICEYFPFLARLPKWLPGAEAIGNFEEIRSLTAKLRDLPFNDARNNFVSAPPPDSSLMRLNVVRFRYQERDLLKGLLRRYSAAYRTARLKARVML